MLTILIGCLMGIFTIHAQTPQHQDTLSITLEEALEIALSENPNIHIADQEVTKMEYARRGTYAALYPQIDLIGSYQHNIKRPTVETQEGISSVGYKNNWTGGTSVTLSLISVSLWRSLKLSALDIEMAIEQARSSRVMLIEQVKRAYYAVLLARDALTVFEQAYNNAIHNHNIIREKYEQGLLAEFDLVRANVNVKNAEPVMYDAESSLTLARWQLKALLGIDLNTEIECKGSLAQYEENLLADFVSIDTTLVENSTLRQLDIQHAQLDRTVEVQRARFLPTLSLSFNYLWNASSNDFRFRQYRWVPNSVVEGSLVIPIFAGGKRHSDIRQTQYTIKQLNEQRLNTERNLRVSVKQYIDQMNTSIKQYYAARAGVVEAEKGYAITMKRYETGEGTLLEINDSQLSLTQAQQNLNQSIFNYLVAKSVLESTLGRNVE